MTNEATRLAEEAKWLADALHAVTLLFESTRPGVTEQVRTDCTIARNELHAAIDAALATLAQPAVSDEAQSIPLGAIRAIAVEAIREVTGCPDILSGEKPLVDALEEVAKAACATFAAMASQEKPHD